MAYNTAAIKKDIDGKPIPQHYNSVTNELITALQAYGLIFGS